MNSFMDAMGTVGHSRGQARHRPVDPSVNKGAHSSENQKSRAPPPTAGSCRFHTRIPGIWTPGAQVLVDCLSAFSCDDIHKSLELLHVLSLRFTCTWFRYLSTWGHSLTTSRSCLSPFLPKKLPLSPKATTQGHVRMS